MGLDQPVVNAPCFKKHVDGMLNLDLRKLGVGILGTIVSLDFGKCEGRLKESDSSLQEVHCMLGRGAVVESLVLNAGSTVDDVILISYLLPVLDVDCPRSPGAYSYVVELTLPGFAFQFLDDLSPLLEVANAVMRNNTIVVAGKHSLQAFAHRSRCRTAPPNEARRYLRPDSLGLE